MEMTGKGILGGFPQISPQELFLEGKAGKFNKLNYFLIDEMVYHRVLAV